MWQKIFDLQSWLNALFSEGWCCLGLPEGMGDHSSAGAWLAAGEDLI